MKKIPAAPKAGATSATQSASISANRSPTKLELCLKHLTERGAKGLNKLEALDLYGDTCLNTSISDLHIDYGIEFIKVRQPHRHRGGGKTSFTRYSIKPEYLAKARELLALFREARQL